MARIRSADHALRSIAKISRQSYVCRTCRAHAIRQFHTSPAPAAEMPWLTRIQQTLFGSKESKEAEKAQEKQAKQTKELAKRDVNVKKTLRVGRKVYDVAPVVDPEVNKDYVPATTWDGLQRIGSREYAKAKADRGEKYIGFTPAKRATLTDGQWSNLLHHVAVEVLALQQTGRDAEEVCLPRISRKVNFQRTRHATIVYDNSNGNYWLAFDVPETQERVLQGIVDENESIPQQAQEQQEIEGQTANSKTKPRVQLTDVALTPSQVADYLDGGLTQGASPILWMSLPLQDPKTKLCIIKRVMQLTGHRIPDSVMSNASTLADLYSALKTKEKPKKLAHTEEMQRMKEEAPNVTVHSRRRTPIDRERDLGRWKVIEDELIARDLPIFGSRWPQSKPQVRP